MAGHEDGQAARKIARSVRVDVYEDGGVNVDIPAGMTVDAAEQYLHRAALWAQRFMIAGEVARALEAVEERKRIVRPGG
jgi:hypothetical protein